MVGPGAIRGAAVAAVIQSAEGTVLEEHAERIGRATNNVAEYRALLLGIQRAAELGVEEVELVGDSELIVRQVNGEYKVKDAALRGLHAEVMKALAPFARWSIRHVRRDRDTPMPIGSSTRSSTGRWGERRPATVGPSRRSPSRSHPHEAPLGRSTLAPRSRALPARRGRSTPGVDIGHVHLKVADMERAMKFYHGVLGFEVQQRWGKEAAFLSAGGYHHHIGLKPCTRKGGPPPPPRHDRAVSSRDPYPTARRSRTRCGA